MKTTLKNIDWSGNARVYIAKDNTINGFYKIGCSKDPSKRCTTIGSGDCSVIYSSHPDYCNGTEVYVHNLLDTRRRVWKGSGKTEWFELSEFEIAVVRELIENHSKYILLQRRYLELEKKFNYAKEIINEMLRCLQHKYFDGFVDKVLKLFT